LGLESFRRPPRQAREALAVPTHAILV